MSHNYKPEWDYQVSPLGDLKPIADCLKQELLSRSQPVGLAIEDLTIAGIKNSGKLGYYVNGTQSAPVLLIDVPALHQNTESFFELVIQTELTILHEFAHSLQEQQGLPFDEDEAESFAQQYLNTRTFLQFWK
jgi:hypothetical protein